MIRRALSWAGRRFGAAAGGPAHTGAGAVVSALGYLRVARPERPLNEMLFAGAADPEAEFARLLAAHAAGSDPGNLARSYRMQAAAYLIGGGGLGAGMLLLILASRASWFTLSLPAVVIPAFLWRALIADFLAWRFERRSWEAPAAYLRLFPRVLFR